MTFNWNNDIILKMIELYRERPILWDTRLSGYKNKEKKARTWEEIGMLLNVDASVALKKMRILIGQYKRELYRSQTVKDGEYNSKWFAFKKMSFLKHVEQRRRPSAAIKRKTEYFKIEDELDATDSDQDLPNEEQLSMHPMNNSPQEVFVECNRGWKVGNSRSQETHVMAEPKETKAKDEFSVFGEMVTIKLRNIQNRYARSTAQYHINNILYKAEIGEYDRPNRSSLVQTSETFNNGNLSTDTGNDRYDNPDASPIIIVKTNTESSD